MILYGTEALMTEEIPHVTYSLNDSYEVAIERHFGKILAIHRGAVKKKVFLQRSKDFFNKKHVKKSKPHNFCFW